MGNINNSYTKRSKHNTHKSNQQLCLFKFRVRMVKFKMEIFWVKMRMAEFKMRIDKFKMRMVKFKMRTAKFKMRTAKFKMRIYKFYMRAVKLKSFKKKLHQSFEIRRFVWKTRDNGSVNEFIIRIFVSCKIYTSRVQFF